jgi:hypothetical protein
MNIGDVCAVQITKTAHSEDTRKRITPNKWYAVSQESEDAATILCDDTGGTMYVLFHWCCHLNSKQNWKVKYATAEDCLRSLID